jgi:hypothetical protein
MPKPTLSLRLNEFTEKKLRRRPFRIRSDPEGYVTLDYTEL